MNQSQVPVVPPAYVFYEQLYPGNSQYDLCHLNYLRVMSAEELVLVTVLDKKYTSLRQRYDERADQYGWLECGCSDLAAMYHGRLSDGAQRRLLRSLEDKKFLERKFHGMPPKRLLRVAHEVIVSSVEWEEGIR